MAAGRIQNEGITGWQYPWLEHGALRVAGLFRHVGHGIGRLQRAAGKHKHADHQPATQYLSHSFSKSSGAMRDGFDAHGNPAKRED